MMDSNHSDRKRARPSGSHVRNGRDLCTVLPTEPTLADKLVASQGRYGVDVFLSLFRKKTDNRRG